MQEVVLGVIRGCMSSRTTSAGYAVLKCMQPLSLTALPPCLLPQVCKACGVDKPASEFYRNRTNADGLFGAH